MEWLHAFDAESGANGASPSALLQDHAELAQQLRKHNVAPELAEKYLERAGVRDGKALAAVLESAREVCAGEVRQKQARPDGATFQAVGERWTSGELAEAFPDHVKEKKTAKRDADRLVAHVYPIVGTVPVADFTLDHAEKVMAALPRKTVRTPATRRHYAQLMHRILGIAVFPLKLIKVNPLPKGYLPKVGPSKAKGWLYPDEDAQLCGATVVPLCSRLLYGFLHREGPRLSEAAAIVRELASSARRTT